MDNSGPHTIEVGKGLLPVPYEKGWPQVDDCYNTTTEFLVKATYASGAVLEIRSDGENGVTFQGEHGRIFVTRDHIDLDGGAVDALYKDPVPESELIALRKGKRLDGHMGNFFECIRDRAVPVSDVWSHHRSLTVCHLSNIAIRLGGRKLTWDPEKQEIVGDPEANAFQTRPQRGV